MNQIYNNVLNELKKIVLEEKKQLKNKILNDLNLKNEIEVNEYQFEKDFFYSDGINIFQKNNNTFNKIGFECNDIFYIFQN